MPGSYRRGAANKEPIPGDNEVDIKMDWVKQLTDPQLVAQFPLYQGLVWFNWDKIECVACHSLVHCLIKARFNESRDYRLVNGSSDVQAAFLNLVERPSVLT